MSAGSMTSRRDSNKTNIAFRTGKEKNMLKGNFFKKLSRESRYYLETTDEGEGPIKG
jgi:hypothetical protein